MTEKPRTTSRRTFLKYGAGISLASALPSWSALGATSILKRAIPRTGEMLPVVGIGTSRVFDVEENTADWRERRGVASSTPHRVIRMLKTLSENC
jgi:hypothetical protein